jgi:ParB-like chromosome segregation protein Spo0J
MKVLKSHSITPRPIEHVKPNPRNAWAHPDEQVAELARSFERIRITFPILVDENGVILAGQGKWLPAQKLNLTEVPVLVIAGLTETEKQLYLIADNQLALNSTLDQEKLRTAIEELEKSRVSSNAALPVRDVVTRLVGTPRLRARPAALIWNSFSLLG